MAIVLQTSSVGGWKDHKQSAIRLRSETRSNARYDLKLAWGRADDGSVPIWYWFLFTRPSRIPRGSYITQ